MHRLLALVLLALPVVAAPVPPIVDAPVAVVFHEPIWQSELDERVSHLPQPHDAIRIHPVTPGKGHVKLAFEVEEGDLYHLGKIAITGMAAADATRELAKLSVHAGDVFSAAKIRTAMDALKASTAASDVVPLSELDPKHDVVNLTLEDHA